MTVPKTSQHWVLQHKPTAMPVLTGPDATFALETRDIPALKQDEVLIKVHYLSNDPAQRGWISKGIDPARLYLPPVAQDAPMTARVLGQVVDSRSESYKAGQVVAANGSWSEYIVVPASSCQPIPEVPGMTIKQTHYLGALGMTGLTAYYGLKIVAEAKASDVVMVSGAAGATGSMVVQIAKHILGCKKVFAMAGTDEKCRWIESLGADRCLNYKSANFKKDLIALTPDFVDVFFDNVAGPTLDLMLTRMNRHGRVAACGAIADYNSGSPKALTNYFEIISMRIQIRGLIVMDYMGHAQEVVQELIGAMKAGKIKITDANETVVKTGFEGVPKVWMGLFEGVNQGKLITEIA